LPLEWRDVLRYQRLRDLHALVHPYNNSIVAWGM
jgi:hypothetical protein